MDFTRARRLSIVGAVAALAAGFGWCLWGSRLAPDRGAPAKIVVVCVFDQMRGDYLDRFAAGFGDAGFRRLLGNGVRYVNCNYPYAETETGPGHTTIGTGRLPRHHGIVANDWFDAAASRPIYCFADPDAKLVGPAGPVPGAGMSTRNIVGEGLSDRYRAETKDRGRVFSISPKDRAAVPMGGRNPNYALWFLPQAGSFGASTAYGAGLPPWLGDFTKAHGLDSLPKSWDRALPNEAYAPFDPDDAPWERGPAGLGNVFPHPLVRKGATTPAWDAYLSSPVSLGFVTDLACELIDREKLGKGELPDLLWISYSATDLVGHAFGPDSHELLDAYARADREVARLLAKLDAAAGEGNYVFAITADHGVTEIPDHAKKNGRDGGRVTFTVDRQGNPAGDAAGIENALSEKLGKRPAAGKRWSRFVNATNFNFSAETLAALGVERAAAAHALVEVLRADPRFAAAFTREEIESQRFDPADRAARALYASLYPGRSGDVLFALREGWLPGGNAATHGTPNHSDTHVPLVIEGPGIPKNRSDASAVTPLDLAPTLAACLRIQPPRDCDGVVLPNLGIESRPASAPASR